MTAGTTALGLGAVTGLGAGAGAAAGWMEPIPVEQAFHMYNHISAAELAVVPATGHDLPYTKTELFTRILLAFFDQHVDTVAGQS